MNRSPLFYPMNRAGDGDAGGVADLQTDVMRFMAILALCLVAVFALVQSIPLSPPTEPTPERRAVEQAPLDPEPQPPAEPPAEPAPAAPIEVPPVSEPVATPTEEPADVAPVETGFTLRFESDTALTRLVARNEIGLYALAPNRALRMSVNRGGYSFWPASVPNQFHEMDNSTVPEAVVASLRRSGTNGSEPGIRWGVTLPGGMSRQLDGYLAEHTSGALIIEANGNLRYEQ